MLSGRFFVFSLLMHRNNFWRCIMIYSIGYLPNEENRQNEENQFQVFRDHLPLILDHERDILDCADYFFCPLDFAFCSWAYVSGDGPLYLGYLLLGWRDGGLTAVCA